MLLRCPTLSITIELSTKSNITLKSPILKRYEPILEFINFLA